MNDNVSVWHYYQPGFVHPAYVPYMKDKITDKDGNKIEINTWKQQGNINTVEPLLVRVNKGMTFQKMFEDDPCPKGWVPGDLPGYCKARTLNHEPVFYSDKAFIAKRQFWDGYGEKLGDRRVSEQTDMRSVNPFTGKYTVYYKPAVTNNKKTYIPPVPGNERYDTSWNLPRFTDYQKNPTSDSYL